MNTHEEPAPEYGPRGYLPPKAGARARKIVLRERMGLGWPLAALAAAVVIALAGVALVQRWSAPGPPWVEVGPLTAVAPGSAAVLPAAGLVDGALIVRVADVRAFAAPAERVVYCPASGHLEAAGGTVWSLDGRLLGGAGTSLLRLPARVYDSAVYLDPTDGEALPPRAGNVAPGC